MANGYQADGTTKKTILFTACFGVRVITMVLLMPPLERPVCFFFASNRSLSCVYAHWVEWSAGFPADVASTTNMPQAWINALNSAVTAGKIPDIPLSTSSGESPTYPSGYDPYSATVCSSTYKCVTPGDIWDAPTGVLALSFDDGPLPVSLLLVA